MLARGDTWAHFLKGSYGTAPVTEVSSTPCDNSAVGVASYRAEERAPVFRGQSPQNRKSETESEH